MEGRYMNMKKNKNKNYGREHRSVRTEVICSKDLNRRRIMIAVGTILVCILVLLGSRIRALASSENAADFHKYYTSITVEPGDNLWSLSEDYVIDHVMNREQFIREVCRLNHISENDVLHSGQTLAIAYYSTEEK